MFVSIVYLLFAIAVVAFLAATAWWRRAQRSARMLPFSPLPVVNAAQRSAQASQTNTPSSVAMCAACRGSGRCLCSLCHGIGRRVCGACAGSGQRWLGISHTHPTGFGRCIACSGGWNMCSCNGGNVFCTDCGGTGKKRR